MPKIKLLKGKYALSGSHKILIAILLFVAVLLLVNPYIYRKELEGDLAAVKFDFLQEGDYILEIGFQNSPEGNEIIIWSDDTIGTDNIPGEEFARLPIKEGAGIVAIPIHLEEGVHNVRVGTLMDGEKEHYFFSVAIQKAQLLGRDRFLLSAICLVLALLIFGAVSYLPEEKYREPAILFLLGLVASFPLFSDTLMGADDVYYHLARIEGIYQGLKAGEFPVRINSVQNGGFGNLSASMYPQLFLYLAAFLRLARVSLILSYKLLVAAMNVGTAFITFYSIKNICKSVPIAYLASALYTFSTYRFINIYFRASLGEALAMTFFPLLLWGAYEVFWGNRDKWILLVLGVECILQSHVLSLEISLGFLLLGGILWLFFGKQSFQEKRSRILCGLKAVLAVCLLSASFLIPFFFFARDNMQVFYMKSEVADSVVYFSQMFALFPGISGTQLPPGSTEGEMPLTIGPVLLLGACVFCLVDMRREWENSMEMKLGRYCLCCGALAILAASWLFPWDVFNQNPIFLKLTAPLQFAWRLFGPASFFLSVTAAIGLYAFASGTNFALRTKGRTWIYPVMAVLLMCGTFYYFDRSVNDKFSTNDEMTLEGTNWSDSMYMYGDGKDFLALHLKYRLEDAYVKTLYGSAANYSDYRKKATQIFIHVEPAGESVSEEYLLFPLYYVPGYSIYVNGEKVPTEEKNTLVSCRFPQAESDIQVRFQDPWFFRAGDVISLSTVVLLLFYHLRKKKKR